MAEDVGSLVVRVAMENSSFQQGVNSLNRDLKVIQSEFKVATATLGEHGKKLDALKINADMLSKSLETQLKIVEKYESKLKESKDTLDTNAKKHIELADSVTKAEKAYRDSEKTLGKNAQETQKLKSEYEKLQDEFAKGEDKIRNNQRAIDNWNIKTNNAKAKLSELKSELESTNKSIQNHSSIWNQSSQQLQSWGVKTKAIGDSIKGVGQSINSHISLPLFGVAAASMKVGADFEAQMSKVQAISGATGDDFKQLNDQALKLGADTAFSAKQAAEGMENLASAGFNTKEIMAAMPGMLDLAAAGGVQIADASDIAASALRGFGLEAGQAGHVADVLARAAADTNAGIIDMGYALKYAAPPAKALGLDIEQVSAAIGIMSNAGIKGEMAGTTLRGALTRLSNPSKDAAEKMSQLGFSAFDVQGKMLPLSQMIGKLQKSLNGLTDQQRQEAIATIFGQESMSGMLTLIQAGPGEIDKLTDSFRKSDGASKEMAETMQNNLKGSIEQLKGSLETAGIKLEQSLAPSLKSITDKTTDVINKFGEADPATQKLVVMLGGIGIAAGPAIMGIGSLVGSIGKITQVTGLSMATLGPWGVGIGVAGIAALGLAKYLKSDCIPAVDIFASRVLDSNGKISKSFGEMNNKVKISTNDFNNKVKASAENSKTELLKISDSTKKAVNAYVDLDKKAGTALLSLKANNTKVTQAIATDMNKNINNMSKQIVEGLGKRSGDAKKVLTDFFKNAQNITDKEKAEILNKSQEGYSSQQKSAEEAKNKINEIYQNAANAHRELKVEEVNQIQQLQEQMKQQAINTLTQSELEQQAIFEGIKNNAARLSTEQASEVIKNSATQRDQTIAAATEQAKKVESEIIYQRDVTHTLSKEQADKLISEAERQKNDTISKAKEQHERVVSEVGKQCDEVKTTIDTKSGEIKSTWQNLCDWFEAHIIHPKVEMTTSLADNANGIYEKKTGYATGTNNATRGWHMVGEEGPELLWFDGGETVLNNRDTMGLFDKLDSKISYASAKAWGTDLCQGFADGMIENKKLVNDAALETADSIYRVLHFTVPDEGPLSDADTYGADFMELLAQTIEQNADKPKEAAKNVADKINSIIKQKQVELKIQIDTLKATEKSKIDELQRQLRDTRDSETVDIRGTKKDARYGIQDSYKAQKEAIQDKIKVVKDGCTEEVKARKDAIAKEIELLKKGGKEASEQLKKEAEAKKKAAQDIDKLDGIIIKALQRKIEAERDAALETAKTKAKESKLTKDQLSSLLNYTKDYYDKKLDQDKLQATAEQLIMSKNQQAIITLLNKFGRLYEDSGTTLGQRMVGGMKSWTDMVPSIVGNAMQNVQVTVKDAAVNIENTLSSIMEGIQSVGEAGVAVGALSGSGGNLNFDSIFSDWKSNKTDEDKVKEISDKYKQAFNKIELAQIELGREAKNSDEELKKQQKTIDLQKEKLSNLNKEYEEMKSLLGENDDEVVSLKKDIAGLNVEIDNNILKLKQDEIENKYKKYIEALELSTLKLTRETKNFNDELKMQSDIYVNNTFKLDAMKKQYEELVSILGKEAEEVKQLEKDIISFEKEMKDNAKKLNDDMINNINEFSAKIKEALKSKYEEELKLEEDKINKELENLNKWKDESIKRISEVYDAKIKALDEEVKAEDRAEKDREELSKINRLKEAMQYEHNEFNKVEMQKELNRLIEERNKRLHKDEIEDKKKGLEEQKQNEISNINNLYEANRNNLEKQLQDTKNHYAKLINEAQLRAEAEKIIVANNQEEIITLIKSYSKDYEEAGKTLGQKFADSMQAKIQPVLNLIEEVTNKINNLRTKEIEDAKKIVSFQFERSNLYGASSGSVTNSNVNNNKTIVNNNNFTFNSPKALTPSETRRNTETTLRNLAFNM